MMFHLAPETSDRSGRQTGAGEALGRRRLLTRRAAEMRLGLGAREFEEAVAEGRLAQRAEGQACWWPEEVDLARAGAAPQDAKPNPPLDVVRNFLNALDDPDDIAESLARFVVLLTRARRSLVAVTVLAASDQPMLRVIGAVGHDNGESVYVQIPSDSQPVWDDFCRRGEPVLLANAQGWPVGFFQSDDAAQGMIAVPFIVGNTVRGVIQAQGWPPEASPSLEEAQLIAELVDYAAIAWEVVEQSDSQSLVALTHSGDIEAILETALAVATETDLRVLLRVIMEGLQRRVPHTVSTVYRVDEQDGLLKCVYVNWPDREVLLGALHLQPGEGLIGSSFVTGQASCVNDAHLDPRAQYPAFIEAEFHESEHSIQVPLEVDGKIIGVLAISRFDGSPFTPDEFAFCRLLGAHTSVAIRNALLIEEALQVRARTERQAARMESVLAITQAINGAAHDVNHVMELVALELHRLVACDDVTIYEMAPERTELHSVLHWHYEDGVPVARENHRIVVGQDIVGHAAQTGQAENIPFAHLDPRSIYYANKEKYAEVGRHAMVAPLQVAGETIGALFCARFGGDPFDNEDLDVLRILGEQAAVAIRNARLLAESRAAEQRAATDAANLAAIYSVTQALTSSQGLNSIVMVLARELERLVPFEDFTIFRTMSDPSELHSEFHVHFENGTPVPQELFSIPLGQGLVSACYLGGEPMLCNDAHLDPRSLNPVRPELFQATGAHSILIPLTVGDERTGVLVVSRFGGEPFTANEFAVVRALGEQAAVALHDAALLAESQAAVARTARHTANLEAILATARAVSAQQDLHSTLLTLAEHLRGLIPHERLIVWRLDDQSRQMEAIFAQGRHGNLDPDWTIPAEAGVIGRVMRQGQPNLVNNAHMDPDAYHPPEAARPIDVEHLMIAPLVLGKRAVGAIVLDRSGDWEFSAEDLAVFRVLAGQVEVAMQSALLIEEERRRQRHATALVEVASVLNQAHTLPTLVEALAKAAANAVNVSRCSLYVYDTDLSRSVAWYHYGANHIDPQILDQYGAQGPADFPAEQAILETGTSIVGERLTALLKEQVTAPMAEQRGGAVVPISLRGRIVGVFYIWDGRVGPCGTPRSFDAEEMALIEAIGALAGSAVDRARLFAETERRVAELRALGEINAAITRSFDLATITKSVLENIQTIVPFRLGTVVKWDDEAGNLRVIDAHGDRAAEYIGLAVPLEGSINGQVFRTGKPLIHEDGDGYVGYAPFYPRELLGKYTLSVPLRMDDRVIGTLHAIRSEPGTFSDNDLAIFELVAGYLAVGIERAQAFEIAVKARATSERYARNVERVLEVSKRLALEPEIDRLLPLLTDGVFRLVPFTSCAVYNVDAQDRRMRRVFLDHRAGHVEPAEYVISRGSLAGDALSLREAINVSHAETEPRVRRDVTFITNGPTLIPTFHALAIPLFVEGNPLGVVTIVRENGDAFTEDERATAQVYAGQAASVLRNADLLARNRDLYLSGVRALASAVDAKDTSTRGHSERVSRLVRAVAEAMGFDREEAETVELAGLLHDIGKIGIPDAILQKPGRLDDAERAVMMGHSALGAAILADTGTSLVQPLIPLVRHHHEWYNGNGYPDGLATEQIPLGAAIISVVDAFDTIVTDRPYRVRRSVEDAVAELERMAGVQFHPGVVAVFANVLDQNPELARLHESVPAPNAPNRLWELAVAPGGHQEGVVIQRGSRVAQKGGTAAGQLGDLRALGLLMELAGMTRDLTDMQAFLSRVSNMVRRRLSYEAVMLMLIDHEREELYTAAYSAEDVTPLIGHRQSIDVGICGWVIREKRARNVPDVTAESDAYLPWPNPGGSELVVPLIVDDDVIGLINVESSKPAAFTSGDEAVLTAVAEYVATAVHVAQLHAEAKHAAATDGLTGVLNHRAFYEGLENALEHHRMLSVVIFDVEGLKQVNDSAGHLAGDAVLRDVANAIRDHVRPSDIVARYGGDEFAVVLPGIGTEEATLMAATIRASLRNRTGLAPGEPPTTVRYGVSERGVDGPGAYDLIAVADARLYEMKSPRTQPRLPDLLGAAPEEPTDEPNEPAASG